ncbi:UNVERIFIED_CONTAM: hypothetical protein GTU68_039125 [Idotea baltica]|nr:hypothetical protein [Idotea baltica]
MLYEADVNPGIAPFEVRESIDEQLKDEVLGDFAWTLFSGVIDNKTQLDQRLELAAQNWSLSRMAPTDLNALRMGAFEILHFDTPDRVAIDESIELAKKFGSKQSSQFVNGILDKLVSK